MSDSSPARYHQRRHASQQAARILSRIVARTIDVLICRACKGRMVLVAVIHTRKEVRRLLHHLRMFSEPLPLHPARGPPDDVECFDFP